MMQIILRFAKMLGAALVVWIGIWVFNNYGCQKIESKEMEPTLKAESHKMIDPKIRSVEDLKSDDLVSFTYNHPGKSQSVFAARVIGLPGDRVEIKLGEVYVNGSKIGSNYVSANSKNDTKENYAEIIVPRESVYVLCDNRRAFDKTDSRGIGPIGIWTLNGKFSK
ncbi:MAG TPA: signal peptidase I [Planctomycetota bacterium]|nr:signal peptidase I [Planctomycetota bacterium]